MPAAGVGFEGIGLDLIGLASEAAGQGLGVMVGGHGAQEAPLAAQDVTRGRKAQGGQLRRTDAAQGGVGGMERLAHGAVLDELPEARGLGAGGAHGAQELLGGQTQQLAGGHRGGEAPHHSCGMPVVIGAGIERLADTGAGLIAGGDGGQDFAA